LKISVNASSKIFGFVSWAIWLVIGCEHPSMNYWLPVGAKSVATCSLPDSENEHHWRINNISSCILANQIVSSRQKCIGKVQAALSHEGMQAVYITPT
jgi:hypothetical protein